MKLIFNIYLEEGGRPIDALLVPVGERVIRGQERQDRVRITKYLLYKEI